MNVYQLLKEKYLPDMEFVFDFLAKLTDEITKHYPDVEYSSVSHGLGFVLKFGGKYEVYTDIATSDYNSGAPVANISLDYRRTTEYNNVYLDNDFFRRDNSYLCRMTHSSVTKYKRTYLEWKVNDIDDEMQSVRSWFTDVLRAVNEQISDDVLLEKIEPQRDPYLDCE